MYCCEGFTLHNSKGTIHLIVNGVVFINVHIHNIYIFVSTTFGLLVIKYFKKVVHLFNLHEGPVRLTEVVVVIDYMATTLSSF